MGWEFWTKQLDEEELVENGELNNLFLTPISRELWLKKAVVTSCSTAFTDLS